MIELIEMVEKHNTLITRNYVGRKSGRQTEIQSPIDWLENTVDQIIHYGSIYLPILRDVVSKNKVKTDVH